MQAQNKYMIGRQHIVRILQRQHIRDTTTTCLDLVSEEDHTIEVESERLQPLGRVVVVPHRVQHHSQVPHDQVLLEGRQLREGGPLEGVLLEPLVAEGLGPIPDRHCK